MKIVADTTILFAEKDKYIALVEIHSPKENNVSLGVVGSATTPEGALTAVVHKLVNLINEQFLS